jgi:hypothetical protein
MTERGDLRIRLEAKPRRKYAVDDESPQRESHPLCMREAALTA